MTTTDPPTEVAIFERLFTRGEKMTRTTALYLLDLEFSEEDKERMHELAVRNQEGRVSKKEREELLGYAKAGCLLGILQSRARKFLKRTKKPAS
jgi:hypothetical protein